MMFMLAERPDNLQAGHSRWPRIIRREYRHTIPAVQRPFTYVTSKQAT